MKYLLSKDSVSYFTMTYFSNKGFSVGCFSELYMSVVLSSLTGSAVPKLMPPPPPGMGLKGPPFGESVLYLKHVLCNSAHVYPSFILQCNVINMPLL